MKENNYQLEVMNYDSVLGLALDTQKEIAVISDNVLTYLKVKDLSKVSEVLRTFVTIIDNLDKRIELKRNEKKGFLHKIFNKEKINPIDIYLECEKALVQIERTDIKLQMQSKIIKEDIEYLKQMQTANEIYYKGLTAAIELGKKTYQDFENNELKMYEELAINTSNQNFEAQHYQTAKDNLERLNQKIYDLEMAKNVATQSFAQISSLIQSSQVILEKIQNSALVMIPLWKSQISTLLGKNQDDLIIGLNSLIETQSQLSKDFKEMIVTVENEKNTNNENKKD